MANVYFHGDIADPPNCHVYWAGTDAEVKDIAHVTIRISAGSRSRSTMAELQYHNGSIDTVDVVPDPTAKNHPLAGKDVFVAEIKQTAVASHCEQKFDAKVTRYSLANNGVPYAAPKQEFHGRRVVRDSTLASTTTPEWLVKEEARRALTFAFDAAAEQVMKASKLSVPTAPVTPKRMLRVDDIGKACMIGTPNGAQPGELVDIYMDNGRPFAKVEYVDGIRTYWTGHEVNVTMTKAGSKKFTDADVGKRVRTTILSNTVHGEIVGIKTGSGSYTIVEVKEDITGLCWYAAEADTEFEHATGGVVTRAAVCDECNDTGEVELLNSVVPCSRCKP